MRCYGKYKDDRICDLCKEVNHDTCNRCVERTSNKKEKNLRLKRIMYNCPYYTESYDDYYQYDACKRKNYDCCEPSEECLRLIKNKEN